jgi:hypothetical protein
MLDTAAAPVSRSWLSRRYYGERGIWTTIKTINSRSGRCRIGAVATKGRSTSRSAASLFIRCPWSANGNRSGEKTGGMPKRPGTVTADRADLFNAVPRRGGVFFRVDGRIAIAGAKS